MIATLRARWRAAPVAHRVMLLAAPTLMLAWLLVRGEPAKLSVLLLGLVLLLATATTAVRQLTFVGAHRTIILIAVVAALANCSAQRSLFSADFARARAEVDAMTCADALAIEAGHAARGRTWTRLRTGDFESHAPQAWRWMDLYLQPLSDRHFTVRSGVLAGDDIRVDLDCRTGATARR